MVNQGQELERALTRALSFSSDSKGLLKSLLPHRNLFRPYSEILRRGTVLWSLTSLLDQLCDQPDLLASMLPTPSIDSSLSALLRDEAVTTASIVYRSWVSLVYMRSDAITQTLKALPCHSDHLSAFIKLLFLDDVRHIRNAISHGTFEAEFHVFHWRDRQHSGKLSYEVLSKLNTAVFTIWLNIDAVAVAPDNAVVE